MDYILTFIAGGLVGLFGGGYLFYRWGRKVGEIGRVMREP